jgi:hypothetical protein
MKLALKGHLTFQMEVGFWKKKVFGFGAGLPDFLGAKYQKRENLLPTGP